VVGDTRTRNVISGFGVKIQASTRSRRHPGHPRSLPSAQPGSDARQLSCSPGRCLPASARRSRRRPDVPIQVQPVQALHFQRHVSVQQFRDARHDRDSGIPQRYACRFEVEDLARLVIQLPTKRRTSYSGGHPRRGCSRSCSTGNGADVLIGGGLLSGKGECSRCSESLTFWNRGSRNFDVSRTGVNVVR
jgi:hypothetical protein